MNFNIKDFKIKNKSDKVNDDYMFNGNEIIVIPEKQIYMKFVVNNQNYIVFSENLEETEEMDIMFAKVELIDGNKILKNIGNNGEYESVIIEFYKRLEMMLLM